MTNGQKPKLALLMRHSQPEDEIDPRHLSGAGIEKARRASITLLQAGLYPELILNSPESAASETAHIVKEEFARQNRDIPIKPDERLERISGMWGETDIRSALGDLDDALSVVLIVSHFAEIKEAAKALTGEDLRLGHAEISLVQCVETTWKKAAHSRKNKLFKSLGASSAQG